MEFDEELLTKDLEVSVACLPTDYRVHVGWDPQRNQDVGWITLKTGSTLDFSSLQLRDYNMNIKKNYLSHEAGSCDFTNIKKKSALNENIELASHENIRSVDGDERSNASIEEVPEQGHKLLPREMRADLENLAKSEDAIDNGVGSSSHANEEIIDNPKIQTSIMKKCKFCNRKVAYLPYHLPRCQAKNSKNKERVKCPLCDFYLIPSSLSAHMRTHVRAKRTCPICRNKVNEEKYDAHLKICKRCAQCGKIFRNKLIYEKHLASKHPYLAGQRAIVVGEDHVVADGLKTLESSNTCRKDSALKELTIKTATEAAVGGEDSDNLLEGQSIFSEDDIKEARYSLHFEFEGGGKEIKKKIEALMFDPVEHALKKFCKSKKFAKIFGYSVDQLEFKSNDTLLTGEELTGSIGGGLIKVNPRSNVIKIVTCLPNVMQKNTLDVPVPGCSYYDSSLLGSSEASYGKTNRTGAARLSQGEMSLGTQYVVDFSQF